MSLTKNSRSRNSVTNPLANPAKLALDGIKEKKGAVIHIAITPRTTIELPAHLSEQEIAARIDNYKKLHSSKI